MDKSIQYKQFTIIISEQDPTIAKPSTDYEWQAYENDGFGVHKGTYRYEVRDAYGNTLINDEFDMWDYESCLENTKRDIDAI